MYKRQNVQIKNQTAHVTLSNIATRGTPPLHMVCVFFVFFFMKIQVISKRQNVSCLLAVRWLKPLSGLGETQECLVFCHLRCHMIRYRPARLGHAMKKKLLISAQKQKIRKINEEKFSLNILKGGSR